MLKLKLRPDREPHCARPGCDERIGTIRVDAWEMAHDEFEASSWSEIPDWTRHDNQMTKYGGRTRRFVFSGRWRVEGGIWRLPKRHRSQRPRVTSFGDVTSRDYSPSAGKFDPYLAPALPLTVECPRCRARQTAEADALEVSEIGEGKYIGSGREPKPHGKVHTYMTERMDAYIEGMAADYYANRDDSEIVDEPLEEDPHL